MPINVLQATMPWKLHSSKEVKIDEKKTNMNSCLDFNYLQLEKGSPIFNLPDILGKKRILPNYLSCK